MANDLTVDVNVDVSGLPDLKTVSGELDKVGQSASRTGDISTGVFQGVGQQVTRLGADLLSSGVSMVIDQIGSSIELASNKAEAANKAQTLFGAGYDTVAKASQNAATAVGLSSGAYLDQAGILGNLTTNLGFTGEQAAGMSVDMLQLAADMGSFNNADTSDVVTAMGAAFRGETEPIRAYGVFLDDARVKAEATALGLYDGVGALDANAKAQATYSLILAQTGAAQGDFARTSDGLANQQKIAAAAQEEAWTKFGASLIPVATLFTQLLTPAIEGITFVLGILADNVPTVIAVLIPLGIAIAATVVPPFIAWAVATLAATWPLIAIAAAVGALIFILDQLGILDWLIGLFGQLAGVLKGPVDAALGLVQQAFGVLRQVVDIGAKVIGGAIDSIGRVFTSLGNVFAGVVNAITGGWSALWAGIQRIGGQIMAFVGQLFKPLVDGINWAVGIVKDAWNGFARAWNGFEIRIPRIEIPNPLGGQIVLGGGSIGLPHLPTLAKGGIAMAPMLALIGDAPGGEAVIPLDRLPAGATYNVYVSAGVGDPVAIGREIVEAIRSYERANGPAF